MNAFKTNRKLALLTGAVLLTPALLAASATPAHADKSKTYKTGAVVLGAAAAYLALKGKTLPAAVAAAGGYYAYKKGQDVEGDDRYDDYYGNYDNRNDNDYYSRNDAERRQERRDRRNNSYSRNGDYGYDTGYYGNSGSNNSYDNGSDSSYDNSYDRDDNNGYRGYKNYGQWKKAQRTIR